MFLQFTLPLSVNCLFIPSPMEEIEIRLCKTWDECVQCEEVQKQVWEMPDYRDVVPANLLITAIKNGGILVGAFDAERMIGFAFGILGSELADGLPRYKHTSHMLAVLPDARVRGLGAQMKWFQRAEALRQGLDLMTWTYDPLQAVNAALNLVRLGAVARRYYRNAYGDMTDALNIGVASDRFEVEWYLKSPRTMAHQTTRAQSQIPQDASYIYQVEFNNQDLARIVGVNAFHGETLLVEIPADFNAMKTRNRPLAVEWRAATRETFEGAFASGYVACDVHQAMGEKGNRRVFYVLRQHVENFI